MHSPWLSLSVAALAALAVPQAVAACGDKLVVLGRGVRFERIIESEYPGTIVLYLNPRSRLPAADEQFHLSSVLELAGHTVLLAKSRAELERSLREEPADLVLADIVDARSLSAELTATPAAPVVLPVLYKPTDAELAEAQRQTACLGQAAKRKRGQLLRTVESLLERRAKGLPTGCGEETDARSGA